KKYLGLPFDIHGGGSDLIFPHHENEIAQAECAWGQGFANYWMHSGMLKINDEKMSKSLGNFLMLDEILENTDAKVLRMLTLQTHYRSPLNFSEERLVESQKALANIENCLRNLQWLSSNATGDTSVIDAETVAKLCEEKKAAFVAHMDDDFNAPAAVGEVSSLTNELNKIFDANVVLSSEDAEVAKAAASLIVELMGVFGIDIDEASAAGDAEIPAEIKEICDAIGVEAAESLDDALAAIIEVRANARANKDWGTADKIRDSIAAAGWTMEDTAQGTKIYR
ncbi:MAG: class I tRNA ligase family protein, partial [Phoenicibacter congonensis]|nr:class I tRNA ligase family protein [Phoenicibacter congonensis]